MSNGLQLSTAPTVHATMGIRRPAAEAFNAFVDPDITKRFWIADSTGPLEPGSTVTWTMNAAGAEATVKVREFEVTETGFDGNGDELAAHATDSTGGFTTVLCSLKALLEHDIELGAVTDRLLE